MDGSIVLPRSTKHLSFVVRSSFDPLFITFNARVVANVALRLVEQMTPSFSGFYADVIY